MSKLIYEMETREIFDYLKKERFIHGLYYVDREEVTRKFGIKISDEDWLGFANFYTEGFNRQNDFPEDGEYQVIYDWEMDKFQYGSMIINQPEKFY